MGDARLDVVEEALGRSRHLVLVTFNELVAPAVQRSSGTK
jgi:hypothetical protein